MEFKAYVFDLDGTLLDTLPDLVILTNAIMEEHGWPTSGTDAILSYIGGGAGELLRRAAPADATAEELAQALETWRRLVPELGHAKTKPFAGITELLEALKAKGAKMAVLSNKVDDAAQDVVARIFPGVFDVVHGNSEDIPLKPDPTGLELTLRELGVLAAETCYVGDTNTDMKTASTVGCFAVGCAWGYGSVETMEEGGADVIVDAPLEILEFSPAA